MTALATLGRSPAYRLRAVLAVIAVVPLLGAGWFATAEVAEARAERARVEEVNTDVQRLVSLSELRTRLLDERNWSAAASGLDGLGLTPQVVQALTQIDIPGEAAQAAERVDELVAGEQLDELGADLAQIRGSTDQSVNEVGSRYQALELQLAMQTDALLESVLDDASAVRDRGALTHGLRVLEAATIARQAVSSEFNFYFQVQFSNQGDQRDVLTSLVSQDAIQHEALAELDRIAFADSDTRAAIDEIDRSPDVAAFDEAVIALVEDAMSGAADEAELTAVLADLRDVATVFEASTGTTHLYFRLVDSAGQDMEAASQTASDAVDGRHQRALASVAGLALVSVFIAVAGTRAIARPIQRLGVVARQISEGEVTPELIIESGPVEVRDAARAINEASSHLELATRQALALAQGDLDHDSLQEPSPGSLGASLQTAVKTLAGSLHEREEFRRRMTHEATHDGLTQLPNRNASLGQLRRGLVRTHRQDEHLAVLFIDLDGFKDVNDHHGHHAGDVVLRVAAQRLATTVRESDHVGRLGGDEFLVIAEPVRDSSEAMGLARRLHAVLVAPIQIDEKSVTIGASIGVAISRGDTGNPQDLLRDADLAVYQAKELGRDRIELCDDELRASLMERAELEQAIRVAVMDDQFTLQYQPIVEPRTETVSGYEALVRWNRPGHGTIDPDTFVPFAERSDLIVAIDRWVVRNVAKQIVAWDATERFTDIPISVNISGRSLADHGFVDDIVGGPIDEYGIDASRIIVEVTESAILDDLEAVAHKLQLLRDRGIHIAIDDFGTGYTSLAHLKGLPVDILKIDRSFINDRSAVSLVQLIIDTGHLLGVRVTAEGIETPEQASQLAEMGSDDLQGYLYGYPKPAAELEPPSQIGSVI